MKKWAGIDRKRSPVDDDDSRAWYLQNASLRCEGEARRRPGYARANFANAGAAILGVMPANPSGGGFVVLNTGTTLEGFTNPLALWNDPRLVAPTGTATLDYVVISDETLNINVSDTGGSLRRADYDQNSSTYSGGAHLRRVSYNLTFAYDEFLFVNSPCGGYVYPVTGVASAVTDLGTSGAIAAAIFNGTQHGGDYVGVSPWPSPQTLIGSVLYAFPASSCIRHVFTTNDVVFPGGTGGCSIVGSSLVEVLSPEQAYDIEVTRGDEWTTAFDIYAANGVYPTEPGNGVFVETLAIAPSATIATTSWTPPVTGSWKFIAVPRRGSLTGPFGRLV